MPVSYHRTVLPNSLTVVSENIPYTHSVAAEFWLGRKLLQLRVKDIKVS